MPVYTYEQFKKAAQDSGLLSQFSQADLNLAQKNPDAGMSILKGKQDFQNATTDEARALAHQRVEDIRRRYPDPPKKPQKQKSGKPRNRGGKGKGGPRRR